MLFSDLTGKTPVGSLLCVLEFWTWGFQSAAISRYLWIWTWVSTRWKLWTGLQLQWTSRQSLFIRTSPTVYRLVKISRSVMMSRSVVIPNMVSPFPECCFFMLNVRTCCGKLRKKMIHRCLKSKDDEFLFAFKWRSSSTSGLYQFVFCPWHSSAISCWN